MKTDIAAFKRAFDILRIEKIPCKDGTR